MFIPSLASWIYNCSETSREDKLTALGILRLDKKLYSQHLDIKICLKLEGLFHRICCVPAPLCKTHLWLSMLSDFFSSLWCQDLPCDQKSTLYLKMWKYYVVLKWSLIEGSQTLASTSYRVCPVTSAGTKILLSTLSWQFCLFLHPNIKVKPLKECSLIWESHILLVLLFQILFCSCFQVMTSSVCVSRRHTTRLQRKWKIWNAPSGSEVGLRFRWRNSGILVTCSWGIRG